MKEIIIGIAISCGAALLIFVAAWIRKAFSRNSREASQLGKIVPAVNALLEMQGPQTEALIALLEAQQGKCNGNVERALDTATAARDKFDGFLRKSAKVEVA